MSLSLSGAALVVNILMVALGFGLAVGFTVLARHRFVTAAPGRAWLMIVGAVAGAATSVLWGACIAEGVGPFFMPISVTVEATTVCPTPPDATASAI